MLDGSSNPALPLNSTVFPSTNFQRKRATGISPEYEKFHKVSAKSREALSTGAERLTVEAARNHPEILEVRECAPFRRYAAGELVGVVAEFAQVEHLE